jgi:proline dehydrogenase
MNPLRTAFLAASESAWLRDQAQRRGFVRRAVSRFMPGETLDDALGAARSLAGSKLGSILTHLGENVRDDAEARAVTDHYLDVVRRVRESGLDAEVSVKLTQLGLDLGTELAIENLGRIADCARSIPGRLWIDMESSPYVERTLQAFQAVRERHPRLGVAIQSYLHRSAADLESLVACGAAVRLVKGAYREPHDVAMPSKADVDRSFYELSVRLLADDARRSGAWLAAGTHDLALIARIAAHADAAGIPRDAYEFAMLYGIQRPEQQRLAGQGYRCRVLVSYGSFWFPWYMRRLAERPANAWFVVRGAFAR